MFGMECEQKTSYSRIAYNPLVHGNLGLEIPIAEEVLSQAQGKEANMQI